MTHTTQSTGAIASAVSHSAFATEQTDFERLTPGGIALFSVNPGINVRDALEFASGILMSAEATVIASACNANAAMADTLHGSANLIAMARATVNASIGGLMKGDAS